MDNSNVEWFDYKKKSLSNTDLSIIKINKHDLNFSKPLLLAINKISPKVNFGWRDNILIIKPVIDNKEISRKIVVVSKGYGQIILVNKLMDWFDKKNIIGKYLVTFNSEQNWFEADIAKQI